MKASKSFSRFFFPALLLLSLSELQAQVGNDNPTGPTGQFNGNITTGCSYDPYTGNVTRTITDLTVAGAVGKYGLSYSRTWNSRDGAWRNSFGWKVAPVYHLPAGVPMYYTVIFPDGRNVTYNVPGPTGPAGVRERFKLAAPLCYLLLPDGGKIEFQNNQTTETEMEDGVLVTYYNYEFVTNAIIDPYGQRTVYSYNTDGTLYRITEPAGRWIQFFYTGGGQVDYIQASDGRIVDYTYSTQTFSPGTTPYTVLTSVKYFNDATLIATYTYDKPNVGSVNGAPVLKTCADLMYDGPMKKISYTYATANNPDGSTAVYGQILSEKSFSGADAVSTLTVNFLNRTETRGDGKTRTIVYDSYYHFVTSVTDFNAVAQTQSYDANIFLNAITDRNGKTTNFTNDPITGNVTQIQYPLTPPDGTRATVQYVYGYAGCPDPNNQDGNNPYYLYSVTNELGKTTTFLRDTSKRIIRINYPDGGYETFTYNSFGQVLTHRMTSGGTESFTYDARGLKTIYRDAVHQTGNPTAWYLYDGLDRVWKVTDGRGSAAGDAAHTTISLYNSRGQVTRVTRSDGNYLQEAYNSDGTLAWMADENHPGAATDPNQRTRFLYDEYKRVLSVTDPLNHIATNSYLEWNQTSSYVTTTSFVFVATAPSGKNVYNYCDNNFRLSQITQAPMTSDAATTTFAYDGVGNRLTVTQPNAQPGQLYAGVHSTAGYDARNRRVSMTDALNQTTSWAYDKAGNLIMETRPDTKCRTWDTFDAMNRVTHTTGFRTDDTASYIYDLAGNLTQMTDSKGANYNFGYDLLNRKTSATYPLDSYGVVRWEAFTYDAANNLSTYRTPYGWIKTFTYDNRNRPTSATWNAGTYGQDTTTTYDAASRVTSIVSGPTTVAFGYDNANHKISETQTLSGLPARTVSVAPDVDGNRSSLYLAGVYSLSYDYTQRQQLAQINTTAGPTPWFHYTYDVNGNVLKRQNVRQGLDATSFEYDQLNRPTKCFQSGANDAVFATSHYDYDVNNNVQDTYREEQSNKGERFGYDFANQLSSVVYNANNVNTETQSGWDRSVSYTNTPLNRTSMNDNGVVTNYTPDGLNQYTAVTGQTPVYDGNFHLYSYGGWTYVYDADKRLTSATATGHSAQFVYDGLGRCVKRTIDGGAKVFTYDGWKPIAEWDAAGALVAWNIYGPGADEILTRTETGVSSYLHYHLDPMGNVQFLLDAGNNGIEKYTYDAFGQPKITDWSGTLRTTSAYGNRFMFTGREYLSTLGIYDYRNRAYHAGLGRFLQTDPSGFAAGDANLFRYCRGNPVNRSDSYGLQGGPAVYLSYGYGSTGTYDTMTIASTPLTPTEAIQNSQGWDPLGAGQLGLLSMGGGGRMFFGGGFSIRTGVMPTSLSQAPILPMQTLPLIANLPDPVAEITTFLGGNFSVIPLAGGTVSLGLYVSPQGSGIFFAAGTGEGVDMSASIVAGYTSGGVEGFAGPYTNTSMGGWKIGGTILQTPAGQTRGYAGTFGLGLTPISGSTTYTNTWVTPPVPSFVPTPGWNW